MHANVTRQRTGRELPWCIITTESEYEHSYAMIRWVARFSQFRVATAVLPYRLAAIENQQVMPGLVDDAQRAAGELSTHAQARSRIQTAATCSTVRLLQSSPGQGPSTAQTHTTGKSRCGGVSKGHPFLFRRVRIKAGAAHHRCTVHSGACGPAAMLPMGACATTASATAASPRAAQAYARFLQPSTRT